MTTLSNSLKTFISLLFVLLISACSSTQEYSHEYDTYDKKPLTNDTELLVSLLKRPTPADQILMEQFAETRAQYFNLPEVSYVTIKGASSSNNSQPSIRPKHHLDALYNAYNTNFVLLTGAN